MEITDGNYRWKLPMEITDGNYRWKLPMEITDGNYQWKLPMEITDGENYRWKLPMEKIMEYDGTDKNYRWKLLMGRGHVSCDVTLPHDGLVTESKHIFSDPIMDPILLEKQNKNFFHQLLFFMLPDIPQLGKPL